MSFSLIDQIPTETVLDVSSSHVGRVSSWNVLHLNSLFGSSDLLLTVLHVFLSNLNCFPLDHIPYTHIPRRFETVLDYP